MYILFILFFISLVGLLFMIGRKLAVIEDIHLMETDFVHPHMHDLQKFKNFSIDGIKKLAHITVVLVLRLYVKSANLLKSGYEKVSGIIFKRKGIEGDKAEVSKFLKKISEYKHKIKEIKHKIHEEENNL